MEIKKIALATDFSKASNNATEYAKALAKKMNLPLMIVHAFSTEGPDMPAPYFAIQSYNEWLQKHMNDLKAKAQEALDNLAKSCTQQGITCEKHLIEGAVAEALLNFINKNKVELLVMGTHGYTGLEKWIMGSTAGQVLRSANCAVLTVK